MSDTINLYKGELFQKKAHEIQSLSHNYDYLVESIEGNIKTRFITNNPDKKIRDELAQFNFVSLHGKIDLYIERIDPKTYENYGDFVFLQDYIKRLFSVSYGDQPLLSVFETLEIKQKFFDLMKKYIFVNFPGFMMELAEKFPKPISNPAEDEVERLLNTVINGDEK